MAEILSTLSSTGDRGTPANGGAYYTSLVTWEATQQKDLVGAGDTEVLECYEGTTVAGNWQADGSLDDVLNLTGWTTGASNYITIRAASGEAHGGTLDSGFRVVSNPGNFTHMLSIGQTYTVIEDIHAVNTNTGASGYTAIILQVNDITVRRCIVRSQASGTSGSRSALQIIGDLGVLVENCLAYDSPYAGFYDNDFKRTTFLNCTSVNTGRGFTASAQGLVGVCKNCVAIGNTIAFANSERYTAESDHNASGDATAPGTNSITSVPTTAFVDYDNGDYRPAPGGELDGAGADLSGDFTDDITGATRTQWDIGAYGIIAAGGVTFDGPDIVAQSGTQDQVFTFDENGEGTVASRFTGATGYAISPDSGPLPAGLSVNATTGNIEGTPTESGTFPNIIIRGAQVTRVLTFAADTAIRLPSRTFANSAANKIEYTAMRTTSGSNLDIWGTDSGADYGRFRSADFRAFRGSTGGNGASAATAHQQDVEYVVTEDVQTPGTLIIDFDSLPGTDSINVGTADTTDAWQIGGRVGGATWRGTIRDFKIYDSGGTLIHHWPIDDDVADGGEITDIVGGAHGTLTLGAGSWGDL